MARTKTHNYTMVLAPHERARLEHLGNRLGMSSAAWLRMMINREYELADADQIILSDSDGSDMASR